MSALAILARARDAGVNIAVDGDDLLLTAPAQPPAAIVDLLAQHKHELIALLRPCRDDWMTEDWHAYFDERAGIIEYDGGISRPEAEVRALDSCIAEWLRRNPVRGSSERCLGCGGARRGDDTLLVFRGDSAGAWLHVQCWPAWSSHRNSEARSALAAMGLGSLGNS
jgi:hypothetical protein